MATSKLERHHMDAGMTEQILPYLFEVMNTQPLHNDTMKNRR